MNISTSSSPELARGATLARALYRFWDPDTRARVDADQLRALASLAQAKGVAALAYARLRSLDAQTLVSSLHGAYLLHRVRSRAYELRLSSLLELLDDARVPYLLWKGWSVARLYDERALRPYGDFDLLVANDELARAQRALARASRELYVDLKDHLTFPPLRAESFARLYAQSVEREHGARRVRCLGPEDELRTVCLHMLKHGAERPLWLCDVALLLERGPQQLDAQRVLSSDPTTRAWIDHGLRLARDVVGANLPPSLSPWLPREPVPAWMHEALLTQWGRDKLTENTRAIRYLWTPRAWRHVLRDRLPNPIGVKVAAGQPPRATFVRAEMLWAALRHVRARLSSADPAQLQPVAVADHGAERLEQETRGAAE